MRDVTTKVNNWTMEALVEWLEPDSLGSYNKVARYEVQWGPYVRPNYKIWVNLENQLEYVEGSMSVPAVSHFMDTDYYPRILFRNNSNRLRLG